MSRKSPTVQKELFEVHIEFINSSIESIKEQQERILVKLEQNDRTLLRNTIIVDEHHKRSNYLEVQQEAVLKAIKSISDKLVTLDSEVKLMNREFDYIKIHVKNVTRITKFFVAVYENKGMIFKSLIFISLLIAALYVALKKSMSLMDLINLIGM